MAGLASLPQELVDLIVQQNTAMRIERDGSFDVKAGAWRVRRGELFRYARLSRAFHDSSQRELLRHVWIGSQESVRLLLETLEGVAGKAALVQTLHCLFREGIASPTARDLLDQLLRRPELRRLLHLVVQNAEMESRALNGLRMLTHLALHSVRLYGGDLTVPLLPFHHLRYLRLVELNFDSEEGLESLINPSILPVLTFLDLGDSASPLHRVENTVVAIAPQITHLSIVSWLPSCLDPFVSLRMLQLDYDLDDISLQRLLDDVEALKSQPQFLRIAYTDQVQLFPSLLNCPFGKRLVGITVLDAACRRGELATAMKALRVQGVELVCYDDDELEAEVPFYRWTLDMERKLSSRAR